jgi:hypothetical protein
MDVFWPANDGFLPIAPKCLLVANEGSLACCSRKSAILASPHLAVSAQDPLVVHTPSFSAG